MSKLDHYLAYAESHRATVCAVAGGMIVLIAWVDWLLPTTSIDFLYLIPVLLSAGVLNSSQILMVALACGILRQVLDPLGWSVGAGRLVVAVSGFAVSGLFVVQLNQRRRLLLDHLAEIEKQIRLRREVEMQVRILVETSPLAILTLDHNGRVALGNESARQLLGFDQDSIQGEDVKAYLPILYRMLRGHRPAANLRTNVESK